MNLVAKILEKQQSKTKNHSGIYPATARKRQTKRIKITHLLHRLTEINERKQCLENTANSKRYHNASAEVSKACIGTRKKQRDKKECILS